MIPQELLLLIFSFCNITSFYNLLLSSKNFHNMLINNEKIINKYTFKYDINKLDDTYKFPVFKKFIKNISVINLYIHPIICSKYKSLVITVDEKLKIIKELFYKDEHIVLLHDIYPCNKA